MLNRKEEAKYARFRKLCKELRVLAPPEILIGLKVSLIDDPGVILSEDKERGHSWTRNYYNWMYALVAGNVGGNVNSFGAGIMSGKNPSGTNTYSTSYCAIAGTSSQYNYHPIWAGAADGTAGIVVGTGDTPFSVEQSSLSAIVATGDTAGKLYYMAEVGYLSATYNAVTKTWATTWTRKFNNNSGNTIIIKETGLYFDSGLFSSGQSSYMVERSVLGAAVSIPYGAQLEVTYVITSDFSAID